MITEKGTYPGLDLASYAIIIARLRNDLYCVEWDVKFYHTILCHNSGASAVGVHMVRCQIHVRNPVWPRQSVSSCQMVSILTK